MRPDGALPVQRRREATCRRSIGAQRSACAKMRHVLASSAGPLPCLDADACRFGPSHDGRLDGGCPFGYSAGAGTAGVRKQLCRSQRHAHPLRGRGCRARAFPSSGLATDLVGVSQDSAEASLQVQGVCGGWAPLQSLRPGTTRKPSQRISAIQGPRSGSSLFRPAASTPVDQKHEPRR